MDPIKADHEQLIQMSSLPVDAAGPLRTESEIKQQKFLLRFFPLLASFHLPHFSDRSLRLTFLFFVTLIGLTSFITALIVGSSFVQFRQQCPLYASFKFEIISSTNELSNITVRILPFSERYSSQSTCDFSTFYNVFTFIYCIMTGFFFVLFNSDHRVVSTNDQCLIIPWSVTRVGKDDGWDLSVSRFPISVILGLFSLVNASILTNGFLKFCSTITSNDRLVHSCLQLNQMFFEQYPHVSFFFLSMLTAIVSSWFQLVFFIGLIGILVIRLGSSFSNNNNNTATTQEKP